MPTDVKPGEVWFAELGMVEKSRPAAGRFEGTRHCCPLTSQIRGLRGEVELGKPRWLPKRSAVNVQGLASFDPGRLKRRMGALSEDQWAAVKAAIRELLDV